MHYLHGVIFMLASIRTVYVQEDRTTRQNDKAIVTHKTCLFQSVFCTTTNPVSITRTVSFTNQQIMNDIKPLSDGTTTGPVNFGINPDVKADRFLGDNKTTLAEAGKIKSTKDSTNVKATTVHDPISTLASKPLKKLATIISADGIRTAKSGNGTCEHLPEGGLSSVKLDFHFKENGTKFVSNLEMNDIEFVTELKTGSMSANITDSATNASGFLVRHHSMTTTFAVTSLAISGMLFVVGVFGNTLIIIIMRMVPFKSTSYGFYLCFIAISDVLSLLAATVNKESTQRMLGETFSDTACKLLVFIKCTSRAFSAANVVFICVERFLVIWFPFKAKLFLSRKLAVIGVVISFVVSNLVGAFHASCVGTNPVSGTCGPAHGMKSAEKAAKLTSLFMGSYLPSCILLTMTPLILMKVHQHDETMKGRKNNKNPREQGRFPQVAAMLLGTILSYVGLVTSGCVVDFFLLNVFRTQSHHGPRMQWVAIVEEVVWTCQQLNFSSNILVYGLVSSHFRSVLLNMLRAFRLCWCMRVYRRDLKSGVTDGIEMTDF